MGLIGINHPDTPDHAPALTSPEAHEKIWADKGYVIVQDEDGKPVDAKTAKKAAASGGDR